MTEAVIRILAGDIEVEISGTTNHVEERIAELQEEGAWSTVLDRLRMAREAAVEAAAKTIGSAELPERGAAFHHLVSGAGLERKPDMVLAAIHYLRDVEGVHDSPPRVVAQLFEDAGLEAPGNLSLYLNRLRERGLLGTPESGAGKNRFVVLTPAGRRHLDERTK